MLGGIDYSRPHSAAAVDHPELDGQRRADYETSRSSIRLRRGRGRSDCGAKIRNNNSTHMPTVAQTFPVDFRLKFSVPVQSISQAPGGCCRAATTAAQSSAQILAAPASLRPQKHIMICCRRWRKEKLLVGLPAMLAVLAACLMFALDSLARVAAVDCFKCSSRNGSNPACEDPFHNLNTTRVTLPVVPDPSPNVMYHTPCYAGKKGREGLFPASACIKLTGTFARMSHCGKFQFEGDLLKGCVLACPEDACNPALPSIMPMVSVAWALTSLVTIFVASSHLTL